MTKTFTDSELEHDARELERRLNRQDPRPSRLPQIIAGAALLGALAYCGTDAVASETCEPNTPCAKEPNVPPHIMRRLLIELRFAKPQRVEPKGPPPDRLLPPGATHWVFLEGRPGNPGMYVPQFPPQPGYCAPPPGMNVPYPCPPDREQADTVKQHDEKNCLQTGAKCPVNAVPDGGLLAVPMALFAAWRARRRARRADRLQIRAIRDWLRSLPEEARIR